MLRFAFIFTFLFLLGANTLVAQSTDTRTIIHGKISYPLEFTVKLEYQDSPLLNPVVMETAINDESKFIFAVDIAEPQFLTLNHGLQKLQIYVTPASRMEMNFEGNDILSSITFSGDNNHDNLYLVQQQKSNGDSRFVNKELDYEPFPVMSNEATINLIDQKQPEAFAKKVTKFTEEKEAKLEDFHTSYPLTESFYELQKHSIKYQDMISRLNYPYVNWGKTAEYPVDYYSFTEEIDFDNTNAITQNPTYRWLLHAYGNYLFSKHADSPDASVIDTYDLLYSNIEESNGKYFLLASLLVNDINDEDFTLVDARKKHFYKNNPNKDLSQIVESAYNNKQRLEVGKPSPSFLLSKIDNESEKVSLYDFDGEIVFVSFWASTCPPCIANFKRTKQLKKEFAKKGVRFVNIAVDENKAACQDLIRKFDIDGINLIAPEQYSEVKYAYKVFLLPGYFVIDAEGNLTSLKGQPLDSVEGKLERLVRIQQERQQKASLEQPMMNTSEKAYIPAPMTESKEDIQEVQQPMKNKKKEAIQQVEDNNEAAQVQQPMKNKKKKTQKATRTKKKVNPAYNFGMIKID